MFTSIVFQHAVPHRFQLTKVLRQSGENALLLHALSEVRLGICSEETAQYIQHLSRNIQPELETIATHIFFKKLIVSLFVSMPPTKAVLVTRFPGQVKRFSI